MPVRLRPSRRQALSLPFAGGAAAVAGCASRGAGAPPGRVGPPRNALDAENRRPGTLDWLLTSVAPSGGAASEDRYLRQRAIEGFVSHTSVRAGEILTGFVSTEPPSPFSLEVFRMGWYGGKGGRLVARLDELLGERQPDPIEGAKRLMECRWRPSFRLTVGADWPSGVYLGKLTARASGHQSYVVFVVREDRRADLMVQVSDLTWQAYNRWPAWRSLYDWGDERWRTTPGAHVGFDRPYGFYFNQLPAMIEPLSNGSGEFLLWEFPLTYWLEREGYDVTYTSNLDTHADARGLRRAKGFLSVGHDEYWTRRMFENVSAARDAGLNLAFLSGNSVDGEIALFPSGDGRPDRVFGRFEGRGDEDDFPDERNLMGASSYGVGLGDWTVVKPEHWLFAGTGLAKGDRIPQLVGWEFHGPPLRDDPTLEVLATDKVLQSNRAPARADFAATIYSGARGNVVFNAGTCWWNMLLSTPPGFANPPGKDFAREDPRVQRITKNLLDRMIASPWPEAA